MEFIKQSILSSKLSAIFDFSTIDFMKSSEFATSNLAKIASELWNGGDTVKQISEKLKLHKHTIIAYLKQGNENRWCIYQSGDGVKRYNQNRANK